MKNKGITLIALVITIIVLLVLVAVSVATLTGENGIITKAQLAKEKTKIGNAKEEIQLVISEEVTRVAITNDKFSYENLWANLTKKDPNFKWEGPEDNCYHITYKEYEFLVDANKNVTYIGEGKEENNTHTGNQIEELEDTVIDGITYRRYEIWNKAQLENFRDRVNNGEKFENCIIEQKADINLNNEDWEPIGYGTANEDFNKYFAGIYDGENHTISGIYINNNKMYQALFGDVWGSSEKVIIENLTIEGNITGGHIVAGLVGRAGNVQIINCKNKVNVTSTLSEDVYNNETVSSTGGILGRSTMNRDVEIINCENYGIIKSTYGAIAGIVGFFQQGKIKECKNYAEIEADVYKIGGIVGFMVDGSIERCYNTKMIKGVSYVGGICGLGGYNTNGTLKKVSMKQCSNTGEIQAKCYVGGIAGWLRKSSSLEQCSNSGNIFSTDQDGDYWSCTGGIIGCFGGNSKISYCYNVGNIKANYRGMGGIAGDINGHVDEVSYIKYCYNVGDITNTNDDYPGRTGGIWGLLEQQVIDEITNCWQLQNCIKQGVDTDQVKVENKTEDEIKALNWENYIVVQGKNNGYPILAWENE